jgi:hypothetical protein
MLTLFAAILSGRQTTYTPRKARISNQHKISYSINQSNHIQHSIIKENLEKQFYLRIKSIF